MARNVHTGDIYANMLPRKVPLVVYAYPGNAAGNSPMSADMHVVTQP